MLERGDAVATLTAPPCSECTLEGHTSRVPPLWPPPMLLPTSCSRFLASCPTRRRQSAGSLSRPSCPCTLALRACLLVLLRTADPAVPRPAPSRPYTAADAPERKLFLRDSHIEQIATMCADIEVHSFSFVEGPFRQAESLS